VEDKRSIPVFLDLLKSGLWGVDAKLGVYSEINFSFIRKIAEEQSVTGLIASGLDYVVGIKVPKDESLYYISQVLQLESRNHQINSFIEWLYLRLKEEGVFALLIKGQGVAQYYEQPFMRAAGDVDLLLDSANYDKAKVVLIPLADRIEKENQLKMHQGMIINGTILELHGNIPFAMSNKADEVIATIVKDSFINEVCVWKNNNTDVLIPNTDDHIILVFTHFLHHFFIEGVGLRQICDWCRLLWFNREGIDRLLLEKRVRRMGLMSEWKVFASLAVKFLGMPAGAMPFYDGGGYYSIRAQRVLEHILKKGNFGHNNDLAYRFRYPRAISSIITFFRRVKDFLQLSVIFPKDAPVFLIRYLISKI